MRKYRVNLRTTPGFHAQYEGGVTVTAENEDDAIEAAFNRLLGRHGTFSDWNRSFFKVVSVVREFDR